MRAGTRTTGPATRVYAWGGAGLWSGFADRDANGQTRSAGNGMSSATWASAIGSQRVIYGLPAGNGDVRHVHFERLRPLPTVIAAIGLALMFPVPGLAPAVRRRHRGGVRE